MTTHKFWILASLLFLVSVLVTNGQTIIRDTISYKTVNEINSKNDSIIDSSKYPDWRNSKNLLIENTSLNHIIDTTWYTAQIEDIVSKWKNKNDVKDDGETNHYYGLVKEFNDNYSIKRLTGTVNYFFGEIGGGYKIDRTIVIQEKGINEILCLFDKSIVLDEKQLNLHFIRPTESIKFPHESIFREHLLEKNTRFQFELKDIKYELTYTADLCLNGFQYGGIGTIYPTYYNIKLELTNKNANNKQVIYRNPHSNSYNISEVTFGDIDNDSKVDIICKISNEMCIRRIVFLSSKGELNKLIKYMGQAEISCWDP